MYTVVDRLLWRAPLWPLRRLSGRLTTSVQRICTPIEQAAFALGPALPSTKAGDRARARYRTRAAFRPTPHGLWAGVGLGRVGKKTALASGTPRATFTVRWANLARLARLLLTRAEVRATVQLAPSPSLLTGATDLLWLPFVDGDDAVVAPRTVAREPLLDAVLAVLPGAWPDVRARVAGVDDDDPDAIDDLLLQLIDDGLLTHDLLPPLLGPPPLTWMLDRLQPFSGIDEVDELRRVAAAIAAGGDVVDAAGAARSSLLPTLLFDGRCELARGTVERATHLLPQLLALQNALLPPAAERGQAAQAWRALDEAHERFGAGSYDVAALALGGYGVPTEAADELDPGDAADRDADDIDDELRQWLTSRLFECLARGDDELRLSPDDLPAATEMPSSAELFLTPAKGMPWLLGHHAPAGATLGHFAHALGAEGQAALRAVDAAAFDVAAFDVAFAPSWSLADLATHPPARALAVGLSTWGPTTRALSDFRVAVDGAGRWSWQGPQGELGAPSALSRVRSSTVEDGVYRLAVGWSLTRQHAPWSLVWPTAWAHSAATLPRVRLGDFVIAPRSFAVPRVKTARALAAWRRAERVPRWVQIGHEDQLLLVDLTAPDAAATLTELGADAPRLYEVWPPLDATVDADGRRVECVVSIISVMATPRLTPSLPVPPPSERATSPWRTFKLFGAASRADRVLADLAPLLASCERWFFLRYRDGARCHLRLRLQAPDIDQRLAAALASARDSGDLVTVEEVDYFAEVGRYGEALSAVEQAFMLDSALTLADLVDPDDLDPACALVLRWDALAHGLGLDGEARGACALELRTALQPLWLADEEELKRLYRSQQADLTARLHAPSPRLAAYRQSIAGLRLPRGLLVDLLHLAANRLAGTDPRWEGRAAYLWQRARESLLRRR